jgi:thiosulfate dehydrogenase [quinone] large subunit
MVHRRTDAAYYLGEGKQMVPRSLLALLRVYLGVILLITVAGKLTRTTPFAAEMLGFLRAMHNTSPWYHQFLQRVVIPNATLFSILVMAGELAAGIALLTGTVTRVGAAIAMFLFLNYMLAKGRWFWSPDSEDAAVFLIAFVVLLGRAGRVAGVDGLLARRWPNAPFW